MPQCEKRFVNYQLQPDFDSSWAMCHRHTHADLKMFVVGSIGTVFMPKSLPTIRFALRGKNNYLI